MLCPVVSLKTGADGTKRSRDLHLLHHFVDFLVGKGERVAGRPGDVVHLPSADTGGRH